MTQTGTDIIPPSRGSIVVELLVAFALFSLFGSALLLLSRASVDARYAISRAIRLGDLVSSALAAGVSGTATRELDGQTYAISTKTFAVSPCLMRTESASRVLRQSASGTRQRADLGEAERLGGDCAYAYEDADAWSMVRETFSASGGAASVVDVLGEVAVVGMAVPPYLSLVDARTGDVIPFAEGFALYAPVNAVDQVLVRDGTAFRRIAYFALATTSQQFAVADLTDPSRPVLTASSTLPGVEPAGSFPQGFRVFAYGGMVYVAARETAGPELHAFDASDPARPQHAGSLAVDSTYNDIVVRDERTRNGQLRLLYAASARDSGEVAVVDVTDPSRMSERLFERTDLPGNQDGRSLALSADRLFLGRASNTGGPEFIVLDISRANSGFPVIGDGEVSTHVTGIVVVGGMAFLAATPDGRANRRIELWDVRGSDPRRIMQRGLSALSMRGIEYDGGTLFAAREDGSLMSAFAPP